MITESDRPIRDIGRRKQAMEMPKINGKKTRIQKRSRVWAQR